MNKYRVIIKDPKHPGNKVIFNQTYDIPEGATVIEYLLKDSTTGGFLEDISSAEINNIEDPNLQWEVYFESKVDIHDQKSFIDNLRKEMIYYYFDTKEVAKTIYQLLGDIGLHYSEEQPLDKDLKKYILEEISHHL